MDPDASSMAVRASAQRVDDRAAPPIPARGSTGGQPGGNARRVRSSAVAWNPSGAASAATRLRSSGSPGTPAREGAVRREPVAGNGVGDERQEGSGLSDEVQLPARGNLRRVQRWWEARERPSLFGGHAGIEAKPSEPQVRYQAATRLEPTVWRKPSRWCETTRTEHDVVVAPRPEPWKRGGVDTRGHVGGGETR
jgi:hypothetical protein